MLKKILIDFYPYKSPEYYLNYLKMSNEITQNSSFNIRLKLKPYIIIFFLILQTLHFFYLYLRNSKLTPDDRIILYDVYYLNVPLKEIQLVGASICLMLIYFTYLLYFNVDIHLNQLLIENIESGRYSIKFAKISNFMQFFVVSMGEFLEK